MARNQSKNKPAQSEPPRGRLTSRDVVTYVIINLPFAGLLKMLGDAPTWAYFVMPIVLLFGILAWDYWDKFPWRNKLSRHVLPAILIAGTIASLATYKFTTTGHAVTSAPIQLTRVSNRHFKNESVRIDGREFLNCKFENVTLLYDGGPYRMINTTYVFGGPSEIRVASSNPTINSVINLMLPLLKDRLKSVPVQPNSVTGFENTTPQ